MGFLLDHLIGESTHQVLREEICWLNFVLNTVDWLLSMILNVPVVRSLHFIVHCVARFVWVKILSGDLRLRIPILNPAVRSNLLVFTDVSCIFCHWSWNRLLRDIIILILIQLWKFNFFIVIRILILIGLLIVKGLFRSRRVYVITNISVLFDFPNRLSKWFKRVIMLVLNLLNLFIKSVVLRNNVWQVLKHLRVFVIFILRSFVFDLLIFWSNFINNFVIIWVLLLFYCKVFSLSFIL